MKKSIKETLIEDLEMKLELRRDYKQRKTKELQKNYDSNRITQERYDLGRRDLAKLGQIIKQNEMELNELKGGSDAKG